MAAIKGQPAPKPTQLSPPPAEAQAQAAQVSAPQIDMFAPPTDEEKALFAPPTPEELGAVGGDVPQGTGPAPQDFAPEPGFAQANVEQFGNVVTRIQAGLAANDQEKLSFLKKKFGPENAVMKDGKIYFRKTPGEKLKKLDPDTLELINDILPDFSREIVQEAATLPGEMLGALGGFLSPVPGGAAAGAYAGRIASVPVSNAAADKIAELAGVPQDEARNKYSEAAVGMAAEAVLPVVGSKLLKRLPGTAAYKSAKEAGEREIVALSRQSQEVARAVEALKAEGLAAKVDGRIVGLPGAEINLMGHQLHPDSPALLKSAAKAANDPRFINAERQLAEDWGDSLKNTLTEIGRAGNKGPYRPEFLAERVTNAVADLRTAEGQAIGKYKVQAMANLKNQRQPLPPEITRKAQDLMTELGFKIQAKGDSLSIKPPRDMRMLVGKLGLTSEGEARAVVNNVDELAQTLNKGATIADIDRLRNSLGSASDSLFRTPAGARLGALSGDMRKFYRQTIERGLPDDYERAAFNSAMDDFGQHMTNIGVLKSALNEDASARAIVRSFFTGKENLARVKAIKQLSPESFSALKEEWINQMMIDYGSRETRTGFKSGALLDALDKKYGKEFLKEVLNDGPGPNLETVRNIAKVTERIELMSRGVSADKMSEAQKKAIADAGIGLIANIKFKVMNGVTGLFSNFGRKDSALMDILSRDGIDKYVANYPGKIDKKTLTKRLTDALAEYKFYRQSAKAIESDPFRRTVKRGFVTDAMEGSANFTSPPQEPISP